jgi:hypothetical protein
MSRLFTIFSLSFPVFLACRNPNVVPVSVWMSSHAIDRACYLASAPDPHVPVPILVVCRTNLKVIELNASPIPALFSSHPDLVHVSTFVFTVISRQVDAPHSQLRALLSVSHLLIPNHSVLCHGRLRTNSSYLNFQ